MRFRPCIDLNEGAVVQIIGASLGGAGGVQTNFTADLPASYFADLYCRDGLADGHLVMLGPGNDEAASSALAAYPGGLQIGGGIDPDNAPSWLDRGAGGVIVTSYIFVDGKLQRDRLERISDVVGRERLVLDLSCTLDEHKRYVVAADRWNTLTDFAIDEDNLTYLASYGAEFLVHATQQEGRAKGIDEHLVELLGRITPVPTTYAGGIRDMTDVEAIRDLGKGRLDFTVGTALDIFGGHGLRYEELVAQYGSGD